jgi:Flp pilus assembly protein TadD
LGDAAGAEAAFRKCIALDPKMPEAHCNLGLFLGREGRFAEAIESLTRGHKLLADGQSVVRDNLHATRDSRVEFGKVPGIDKPLYRSLI